MENNERVWFVADAFYNEKGERVGIISLTLSLAQTDVLIHRAIWKSYLILIATILIVLILVAHHTKLFAYVLLYNQMKEIDEMKDNFIRMATHELQSPIINIRGHLEVLKEELGNNLTGEQEERFKRTDLSAKNLGDLIQDILEVARIEQGRLDFTSQKVSPQAIIQETIEEVKMKVEKKGLLLKTEIQEGPYFVYVNANRFRQILINLLENAIKYTLKGEILVRTKVDEVKNRYLIEVKDTGIGISAEGQKRLFERFYRIKIRETADIPGTGLGLWIAKQFCEKMGGQIFIESMECVGTKTTIIFPLIKG